jgi:hypothetical protein
VNPRDDPFSGLSLSGDAQSEQLDQRLFEPDKERCAKSTPLPSPGDIRVEQSKLPADGGQHTPHPAPPTIDSKPRFDLNETPLYKASFLFTQEELEALEDLKFELRRAYDNKVTKNDLIRSALHSLLENHAGNSSRG